MECVICKNGNILDGKVTVTLERENSIIIVKDVPSKVCNNCGHYYLSDDISQKVFELANDSIERGSEFEVLRLKQAS